MSRRRWPAVLAAAAALLLLADAAAWWAAERALASGFAAWAALLSAQGVAVRAGPATRGGFPLVASRSFALSLRMGGAAGHSEQVRLTLSPTQPDRLLVSLPAPVVVAAPGLPPVSLASADWRLAVKLDGPGAVAMDARKLTATFADSGNPPRQVAVALLHLQAQPDAGRLDLVGSAQSIALPEPLPGEMLPLGRQIASVAFEALWSGRLPPTRALDAVALAAWRDSGGAFQVRRFAVGYGPLGVSGAGRATLDAQLQPQGRATLTVLGYAETLDALVAAHVLSAHAAQAVGAVLGLLARPPEGGGAPQVALEVSVRDRVLTAAGFPLLRLPPLVMPGA